MTTCVSCLCLGLCTAVAALVSLVTFWKHRQAVRLLQQHVRSLREKLTAALQHQVSTAVYYKVLHSTTVVSFRRKCEQWEHGSLCIAACSSVCIEGTMRHQVHAGH